METSGRKRGRPASNDTSAKSFTLSPLHIRVEFNKKFIEKDMYGTVVLVECKGQFLNPWTKKWEELPAGKRSPQFTVEFTVDNEVKSLHFDVNPHLELENFQSK